MGVSFIESRNKKDKPLTPKFISMVRVNEGKVIFPRKKGKGYKGLKRFALFVPEEVNGGDTVVVYWNIKTCACAPVISSQE